MIHTGDALAVLRTLPEASARCCVTSPPYWGLRDYGVDGQMGLEATPEEYVAGMVGVFREVRRVLADDGTLWLNVGDSYAGSNQTGGTNSKETGRRKARMISGRNTSFVPSGLKPKDLVGIPWMLAFALRSDGWYLRQGIVWSKPNPMPESVTDRCTTSHEFVFLLAKSRHYYFNADAIKEPGTYARPRGRGRKSGATPGQTAQGWARRSREEEAERQDKQRGHGRRHAGFNERWDAMERAEQTGLLRNKRSVWTIAPAMFLEAHFATMPEELAMQCALAGSAPGDTLIDPFAGAGTVGVVAEKLGRRFVGIELNPEYVRMADRRIASVAPLFAEVS